MQLESSFQYVPITLLVESPHNPRKRFRGLEDLAASIEEHGIITPLVARPDGGFFEIAAGHRRYRAAKLAGMSTLPVIVREMTDAHFMEVLTVENLQREGVHPYEEAQGYAELMKLPGYDVVAVAGKIGRGESYVRSRLRLLALTEEVAEAFLSDRITFGHARLIAPLPPEKQPEALKACFDRWRDRQQLLPVQDLREWINDGEGEDLSDANFPLDDAKLLPEAGACLTCPKSTCGSGKLFADDSGDELCYDKQCFQLKTEALIRQKAASGLVAISNSYDLKKTPGGLLVSQEYTEVRVTEPKAAPPDLDPDEDDADEPEPDETPCAFLEDAVVAFGHDLGATIKICRNPECPVHGEQIEPAPKSSTIERERSKFQKQQEEEEAKKEEDWARRRETYLAIRADWQPNLHPTLGLLMVANRIENLHSASRLKQLCDEREVDSAVNDSALRAALYVWAEKANGYELGELLVDLLLEPHIERQPWYTGYDLLAIASDQLEIPEKEPEPAKKAKKPAAKKAAKKK